VEATLSFDGAVRVLDRTGRDASIVDFSARNTAWWDVGPDAEELVYIGSGGVAPGAQASEPTFVWVLNWSEIVNGLSGER